MNPCGKEQVMSSKLSWRRRASAAPGAQLSASSLGERTLSLADMHLKADSRGTGLWQPQRADTSGWSVVRPVQYCPQAHMAAGTDGSSAEGEPNGKFGWFICNRLSFCCVINGRLRKLNDKDPFWEDIIVQRWKMVMKWGKKKLWGVECSHLNILLF